MSIEFLSLAKGLTINPSLHIIYVFRCLWCVRVWSREWNETEEMDGRKWRKNLVQSFLSQLLLKKLLLLLRFLAGSKKQREYKLRSEIRGQSVSQIRIRSIKVRCVMCLSACPSLKTSSSLSSVMWCWEGGWSCSRHDMQREKEIRNLKIDNVCSCYAGHAATCFLPLWLCLGQ